MSHKIARYLLDFGAHQSVTVLANVESIMDRAASDQAIKACLTAMHAQLSEAARIAKAAEACALAGSVVEGVSISTDIEQLVFEAGRLHDAALVLSRLPGG